MSVGLSLEMKAILIFGEYVSIQFSNFLEKKEAIVFDNRMLRFVEPMPEWDPPNYRGYINRCPVLMLTPYDMDDEVLLMPDME